MVLSKFNAELVMSEKLNLFGDVDPVVMQQFYNCFIGRQRRAGCQSSQLTNCVVSRLQKTSNVDDFRHFEDGHSAKMLEIECEGRASSSPVSPRSLKFSKSQA